jgi:hypothetical protein
VTFSNHIMMWILGALAAMGNLLCSTALGAEALTGVWPTILDFFHGDYHSIRGHGEGPRGTVARHIAAAIEFVMYAILTFYLTQARLYETARFFRRPPHGDVSFADFSALDTGDVVALSGALAVNLPEWILFLRCTLRLRMRIYAAIKQRQYPNTPSSVVAMTCSMALMYSFYAVFSQVSETAWNGSIDSWLKESWMMSNVPALLDTSYAHQYAGVMAGSLVAGGHNALMEMGSSLLHMVNAAAKWIHHLRRPAGAESAPLIPTNGGGGRELQPTANDHRAATVSEAVAANHRSWGAWGRSLFNCLSSGARTQINNGVQEL